MSGAINNRRELLEFWKLEGNPFMWEDVKKLSKLEKVETFDDLRKVLNVLRAKRNKKVVDNK